MNAYERGVVGNKVDEMGAPWLFMPSNTLEEMNLVYHGAKMIADQILTGETTVPDAFKNEYIAWYNRYKVFYNQYKDSWWGRGGGLTWDQTQRFKGELRHWQFKFKGAGGSVVTMIPKQASTWAWWLLGGVVVAGIAIYIIRK